MTAAVDSELSKHSDGPPGDTAMVKDRAIRGVAWNFFNAGSGFAMQLVRAVVLARLLTKDDFGLAGKAIGATFIATLFVSFGFNNALIQAKELAQDTIESTFTCQFFIGLILFIGLGAASPFLADFYGDPRLTGIILILGFGIWLNCTTVVPAALMQRNLEFKRLNLVWAAVRFLSFAVAITMALCDCSYWTLILPDLIPRCILLPYLLRHLRWRPSMRLAINDLKPVATMSAKSFGTYWLATVNTSLDYAILGRFFSKPVFGLYFFGYQRVRGPIRMSVSSVRSALFPALSKAKTRDSLRSAMMQAIPILAIVIYPLTACLFVTAPQFVPLIFGPEWIEATPIMQAFTVWALFIPVNLVFSSGFLATAIFKPTLIEGCMRAVLIGAGLTYLGITERSILACAVWVVVVEAIGNGLLIVWGSRTFEVSLRWLMMTLLAPTLAVLAATACDLAWGTMRFESASNEIRSYLIFAARCLQILAVCGSVTFLLDRETSRRLYGLIRSLVKDKSFA